MSKNEKQNIKLKPKNETHFFTPLVPLIIFNQSLLDSLATQITRSRILILYGSESTKNEKNQLARSLAFNLRKSINKDLKINEWHRNTDVYDIPIILYKQT